MERRDDRLWLGLAYALLLLSCLRNVGNPDIFWHLSAGRRIVAEHRIPGADWLSFTRPGAPWVDFEWGTQVLVTLLHRAAGFWGLILFKTALMMGAAALVERTMARRGIGAGERACAIAVLTAGWLISNDMRPDWISMLFLTSELVVLEAIRKGRWRYGRVLTGLGAFVAGAMWANCHAGFVLGLAVAGAYALLCEVSGRKAAWALGFALFAGTFMTPFGPSLYHIIFLHMRASPDITRDIVEWHHATLMNGYAAPAFLLIGGCLLAAWAAPPRREEWAPWAVLAGLAFMAVDHQRHIPYFVTAAVLLPPLLLHERPPRFVLHPLCAPVNALLCAAFMLCFYQRLSREGVDLSGYPSGAAAYLRAHPEVASMRLYNIWGWGGYLGYAVPPPYRVFFDGRYIFHDMLPPARAAEGDPRSWLRYLDEQKLDGALLNRNHPAVKVDWQTFDKAKHSGVFPRELLFMPPRQWALLYEDDKSALFVRRALAPKAG